MGKTQILDKTAIGKTKDKGKPEESPIGILPRSSDMGRREKIIIFKIGFIRLLNMEVSGFEPLTSCVQGRCSTN